MECESSIFQIFGAVFYLQNLTPPSLLRPPHLFLPTWTSIQSQRGDPQADQWRCVLCRSVYPPSPLHGSAYWLLMMQTSVSQSTYLYRVRQGNNPCTDTTPRPCGLIKSLHWRRCCYPVALYIGMYSVMRMQQTENQGVGGGRGLYSSRHLPSFIKVGAKTTTKIPCSTLYTLFLYGIKSAS